MTDYSDKRYLGDGVYANFDGLQVILTVEDGGPTVRQTILLKAETAEALIAYIQRQQTRFAKGSDSCES